MLYPGRSFLPDKAIDLIDEAGSRVRLRHIQLPEEARDLDKELKQVNYIKLYVVICSLHMVRCSLYVATCSCINCM